MQKKPPTKINIFFMKALIRLVIERVYLNPMKDVNDKPIANIILDGEMLKLFTLKSGSRQGCPLSSLLFNTVLDCETKRRNKWTLIRIGRSQTILVTDDMILYLKDSENSIRKLLDVINTFSKEVRCKINLQKSAPFFTPKMNILRKNIGKQFHLQ
jgi:hypothetical protein